MQFGLSSLSDLPKMEEIDQLVGDKSGSEPEEGEDAGQGETE
jgi:hypothetical protein